MIDIQHITKRYGGIYALRDVSLRVPKGSVLGLLGQNGAGKTTLLNIITGYLAPTAGQALINGHDSLMESVEAKRSLGYLPEQPPLYPEMTVSEYLAFSAGMKAVRRRAIPAHINEIMELTGLWDMRKRLIANLSKGYRQRVGIAQALCGDPEVLVLDEPTVGLDPKQITEMRGLIRRLGEGRTILFSSHILSEIQQLCDHVVILHNGSVQMDIQMSGMADANEVTLLCTMAAAEKTLLSKLRQLEGIQRVTVQPSARQEQTTALLTFYKQKEPERHVFALLAGLGIPILHLSRCEDSLEQIFLRAISE